MIDVRWHGRGGQGAFTAARLFGAAAVLDKKFALAFPSFGPERRGAPVQAFTRIDGRRIVDRSALRACDFAVVLDETLMGSQVADGIRVGQNGAGAGALLVNSVRPATTWSGLAVRIIALDMSTIARTVLGRPIVNTGMMGALVAASGAVPLDAVVRAVESEMPATLAAKNAQMLRQGYDLCGEALDV